MLIKEYRIPLPMTVEEYRIAQLYMIAKKSREESKGAESGVEILVNEPYSEGPGGAGQFTHKVYHVGSHLPSWFRACLPSSALTVEEEAWNAYPYTKTRFKCPFVDKFCLEIETYYTPDGGHLDNVFKLSDAEKRNRIVDVIDVVKDQDDIPFEEPEKDDPTVYTSQKTGRGPLTKDWIAEHWSEVQRSATQPTPSGKSIMCAYKLCKVEFKYWGMQSKVERFIHDTALRKTMLKAHLQAWVWQDEWVGLTMQDIRNIERETAELLQRTFHSAEAENDDDTTRPQSSPSTSPTPRFSSTSNVKATFSSIEYSDRDVPQIMQGSKSEEAQQQQHQTTAPKISLSAPPAAAAASLNRSKSVTTPSQHSSIINAVSKPGKSAFSRGNGSGSDDSDNDDDEFFDCRENADDAVSLAKWSSMELTPVEGPEESEVLPLLRASVPHQQQQHQTVTFRRVQSMREPSNTHFQDLANPPHSAAARMQQQQQQQRGPAIDLDSCPTSVLILVAHGGSVLDLDMEASLRKSDVNTFRGAFESIMRSHYPSLVGHIAVKCLPCPAICTEALAVLSNLSPYSFDVTPLGVGGDASRGMQQDFYFGVSNDHLPVSAIPLFATSSAPEYTKALGSFIEETNRVYSEFLLSDEGQGFYGQVVMVGDSVGAILSYDALCLQQQGDYLESNRRTASDGSINNHEFGIQEQQQQHSGHTELDSGSSRLSAPPVMSRGKHLGQEFFPSASVSGSTSYGGSLEFEVKSRLDFEVSDFFAFGCPLGLVLAHRKIQMAPNSTTIPRPAVNQIYNLFHPSDPLACRVEPLLSARFSRVPPVNVPRYQKYPMGDGASLSLIEFIQSNAALFAASQGSSRPATPGRLVSTCSSYSGAASRRMSDESVISGVLDSQQMHTINVLKPKWWGTKRIDYALYCPEGLANFPINSLPHLFHSSYWESADVISFILRQVARDAMAFAADAAGGSAGNSLNVFTPSQPREKWIKKRTSVKIRNSAANHRANDVIVMEGNPQTLSARFSYGPLDMAALTGEKVDIHVMKEPPAGDWILVATEVTDKHGRISNTLDSKHTMGYGIYPVRMLVRGDHTMLHMYLAVVPPKTETVVFSIDGSFAASVSVTGKDPKVMAGAVDIVRHWQELGYLIVYVTGRPDMQLQRVVSWLAQHNFPHGLVSFADGFTTDPLRHKGEFLKSLKSEQEIIIHCAYGSSKDISVYSSLGLRPEQIFVVGKVSRKHQSHATLLADGYADHLSKLTAHGGSRPAQGNARMVIAKNNFGLPGQNVGLVRRRTLRVAAKRTPSYTQGHVVQPAVHQHDQDTDSCIEIPLSRFTSSEK